ncbi:sugar ABC transporter substrate-binding protein [Ideonella sp. TBM-1]|uniref:Sugar ABC transporter substrate-binding protein n=2 Tax=Ideonella livida TaxID=2707176 RepID=A0A7C9PI92_9BURK|nr:sugar ABC transporter substrate-binding protein [Ideonella livida]
MGAAQAATEVSMWVHAGPGPERDVYVASIKAFNDAQKDVKVNLVALPEGSYNDQVSAAALAGKLPCILDFDGPNLYNYAWSGKIRPLDGLGIAKLVKDQPLLPTLTRQGTYNGKLYSVAQFDSGLAIWGNRKTLQAAGVRIPKGPADAWSRAEFEDALAKLKAAGVKVPLDMKFNYGIGEWISYGFAPIVQSLGGDLIDRKTYRSAKGALNGPAAVEAMTMLQGWVKKGYVNPGTKNDGDFVQGVSALSWVGHWTYNDYRKALGEELVLIPMPKLGAQAVTGAGSWNFGIAKSCPAPEAASKALEFLMGKAEILRITAANGAVPATAAAQADSPAYKAGGPLSLYVAQSSQGVARVRPETPAYPVISAAFAEAVNNIVNGGDVKKELDKAVRKIDQDIEDNNGYPSR